MEFIQAALTNLIEFTAVAGFTGIAVHAMWTQHKNWMAEFCPPVAPYTQDTRTEVEEVSSLAPVEPDTVEEPQPEQQVIEDVWEMPINSSSARYWVRPTGVTKPVLMLCPAKEEPKQPIKKSRKTQALPKAPSSPAKSRGRKKVA